MIFAALLALAVLGAPAGVVAPKPGADCVTYDAAYERAPLMKVVALPGARVHLQDKAAPCPSGAGCPWARAGYVASGDVVFASAPVHGFRCVYAGSRGRLSAGFVPDAALAPADEGGPTSAISSWSPPATAGWRRRARRSGRAEALPDRLDPTSGISKERRSFPGRRWLSRAAFAVWRLAGVGPTLL